MEKIRDIMGKRFIAFNENSSVRNIAKKMGKYDLGCAIVVKNNKPIGIITERDMVKRVVARNLDVNKERSAVKNNDSKKNDVIIKDRNNNSDVQKKDVNIQRNNDVNRKTEVRKESTNDNRTKVQQQKKEVQRKEVNIQKNNDVNRKTEVRTEEKRNNSQNKTKSEDSKVERNSSDNNKKRSR